MGNSNYTLRPISLQKHAEFLYFRIKESGGKLNVKCSLSSGSRLDLELWIFNLDVLNGKDFFPRSPNIEIFSDPSLTGCGAVCDGVTTRGPWTAKQSALQIYSLELTGALYALKSFTKDAHGLSVRIFLDNSTAVCYINNGRGTKSDELTSVAKQLTEFCEERRLTVLAVHLPGVMNIEVDRESRAQSDASDWLLNRSVFKILTSIWPVKIDHFSYSGTPNCLHSFPGVHNRVRPRETLFR
jgi:hypothetical protein